MGKANEDYFLCKILTEGRVHFENLLKNLFARIVSHLDRYNNVTTIYQ